MDTLALPAGSKLSLFQVENQIPFTTLELSKGYFERDQGIHEFTVALCRQHDHARRIRDAPDPTPEVVNFLYLIQVRSVHGFGHVADRLVGETESATLKRFWDSRLSTRFRDYDRRNNGVGYFRWSDNEPSARHKNDFKRAILLEDGKGHEVVIPRSGHQPFPDLDFERMAKEVREANDWPIDDEMMGKVYEGLIKVLHHDKPRFCKTEKLNQISQSRRATSNPALGAQGQTRSAQSSKRPLVVDSETEFERKTSRHMQSGRPGAQRNSYRPNYGQSRRSADPQSFLPGLHVTARDPTIGEQIACSSGNGGSPTALPISASSPKMELGPGHTDSDEGRLEPRGESVAGKKKEQK